MPKLPMVLLLVLIVLAIATGCLKESPLHLRFPDSLMTNGVLKFTTSIPQGGYYMLLKKFERIESRNDGPLGGPSNLPVNIELTVRTNGELMFRTNITRLRYDYFDEANHELRYFVQGISLPTKVSAQIELTDKSLITNRSYIVFVRAMPM